MATDAARRVQRRYAGQAGAQIHYLETGSGEPVLLLHQTPLSADMYRLLMEHELAGFRLIAADTPGYGQSDPLHDPTMADFAAAMIRLLDELRIETCALIGLHTGASLAVETAATFPKRITRIVLIGCPDYDPDVRQQKLTGAVETVLAPSAEHLAELWTLTTTGMWQGWASREIMQRALLDRLSAEPRVNAATRAVFQQHVRDLIPAIRAPVLLIYGEGDPFATRQPLLAPLFRSARLVELPGIGGIPMQQDPAGFATIVGPFLRGEQD